MDIEETNEEQWKTISLQFYSLIQLIPQVQNLQDTINKMAKIIESKDPHPKYIDVSSLKTVCFCR